MWSIEKIQKFLMDNLKEDRYIHTLGVVEAAEKLALLNCVSVEKARLAALVHDCAKNMTKDELYKILNDNNVNLSRVEKESPQILHGKVGAIIAKEKMGISDKEVLNAIKFHTTGREDMTKLEKVIYIADYIEKNRIYNGVEELREETYNDLNTGVIMGLTQTINFVIKKNGLIHEDTIKARNYLILESNKKEI